MKPFKARAFSIIILAGLIGIVLHAAVKSSSDRIVNRYADCHVHLLDFLQNGEFLNSDKKLGVSSFHFFLIVFSSYEDGGKK